MDENAPKNVVSAEDSKHLVERSYDKIAQTYMDWSLAKPSARVEYLEKLFPLLQDASKARVLELGCGAGIPCAKLLGDKCAQVTAIDISEAMVELAKANVPKSNVHFTKGDMATLTFEPASFEAVVAFYSIIHLPRDEQRTTIAKIWDWLAPGGYLVCNFGIHENKGSVNEDWLGSQMYWSGFDAETYLQILRDIGFQITESEILQDDEDGRLVPFLYILATKTPSL